MRRTAGLLILCFVLMLTSCTGQGDDAASLSTTASSTETATATLAPTSDTSATPTTSVTLATTGTTLSASTVSSHTTTIPTSAAQCKHDWKRAENINEYTAADKCAICGVTRKYIDSDSIPNSDNEEGFKMIRYHWDGFGVGQKEIYNCALGYAVVDCLSKLEKTGDIIPKISEDVVDEWIGELPVERGTVWIECGSVGLFRLNPEMTEICQVQTHFGEGKVLQMTDTLKELLRQAQYYHPYDYWSGTYENGVMSLQQVYKSDSAVEWVEIESIHIENKTHSRNNKITLCVRANESKTVKVSLDSYQSDDNRGSFEVKEIELLNGEEATVEFTFFGFYKYSYWVSIMVDNTKINLTINP